MRGDVVTGENWPQSIVQVDNFYRVTTAEKKRPQLAYDYLQYITRLAQDRLNVVPGFVCPVNWYP